MQLRLMEFIRKFCSVWLFSILTVCCIEIISRGLGETFSFIGDNPLVFIINVNRMTLTTLPALLFRKILFVTLMIQIPWLLVAMSNHLLMLMRGTPFIWEDLQSAGEGASLVSQYFTWNMVFELGILVSILIFLFI